MMSLRSDPIAWCLVASLAAVGCALEAHPTDEDAPSPFPATDTPAPLADEDTPPPAREEPETPAPPSAPPPPREVPLDPVIAATYAAWDARAEENGDVPPLGDLCDAYLDGIEVLIPDHHGFRSLCYACDSRDPDPVCAERGRAYACAPFWRARPGEPRRALVVLDAGHAGTAARASLIIHETIHHLGACTGIGADRAHTHPALWCEGSSADCVNTVHSRAERLLDR